MCCMSFVSCHVSPVAFRVYLFLFQQIGEASLWRVCYPWGLPRQVSMKSWSGHNPKKSGYISRSGSLRTSNIFLKLRPNKVAASRAKVAGGCSRKGKVHWRGRRPKNWVRIIPLNCFLTRTNSFRSYVATVETLSNYYSECENYKKKPGEFLTSAAIFIT